MATIVGDNNLNALNGTSGNDLIQGLGGADIINAGSGIDVIDAGDGNDTVRYSGTATITGGTGSDTFVLSAAAAAIGNAAIHITDFAAGAGGDQLDLGELITHLQSLGMIGSDPFAAGWMQVANVAGSTHVEVDLTGGANGAQWVSLAVLQGVAAADVVSANVIQAGIEPVVGVAGGVLGITVNSTSSPTYWIFSAFNPTTGQEPWITDGTAAGTRLLKDIFVGTGSSDPDGAFPFDFTPLGNGKFVFGANDSVNGWEPWITDGTTAGTHMIKNIWQFNGWSGAADFTPLGDGRFVFKAASFEAGLEAWISDGTEAGTFLLKDIIPGTGWGGSTSFTTLGDGRFIFGANNQTNGYELWVSNGTEAGTQMLKDIWLGSGWSNPNWTGGNSGDQFKFVPLGDGRFVFGANDGSTGWEPWITDGSAAGTYRLKDIYTTGGGWSDATNFTPLGNGKFVFGANSPSFGYEVWISDGTEPGTQMLKDIWVGSGWSNPNWTGGNSGDQFTFLALGNGSFVFGANNGVTGWEPWFSDGTALGTRLIKDIYPGSGWSGADAFASLGDGRFVFGATDPVNGTELWVSDGTTLGTNLVTNIQPGSGWSNPGGTTGVNFTFTSLGDGRVVFGAQTTANGLETWVTDGTAAGTLRISDINPGSGSANVGQFTASASVFDNHNPFIVEVASTDGYGADSKVLTNLGSNDHAWASAAQADGKVLVAGRAFDGTSGDFAVARYNPDGSLDPTFGERGTATLDFAGGLDEARALLVQADGRIVVAGTAGGVGIDSSIALVRYLPDGTLDTSFNGTGVAVTAASSGPDGASALGQLADGSILVAGYVQNGFSLLRYTAAGTLDTSFGSNGIAQVTGFAGVAAALDLTIQPDGMIVVVGTGYKDTTTNYDVVVARFTAAGVLDTNFSGDGFLTLDLSGGFNEDGTSVIVQADGKIVVSAGPGNSFNGYDFALLRFNSNGTPDLSFGEGDGIASVDFAPFGQGRSVVQQPDGRFLVSGTVGNNFAMARFSANGVLDTTFGNGGLVMTDVTSGSDDDATGLLLLPDGRIVLTGASNGDFALVRFNPDGSLDGSSANLQEDANSPNLITSGSFAFDDVDLTDAHTVSARPLVGNALGGSINASIATTAIGTAVGNVDWTYTLANSATQQLAQGEQVTEGFDITVDDGHGGLVTQAVTVSVIGANDAPVLVNAGVGLPGFSRAGKVTTDLFGGTDLGQSVALQPDGKLVVAASSGLVRYHSNGSLDLTFGAGTGSVSNALFGNGHSVTIDASSDPDGKIVVAGSIGLARFNLDGTPDTTFGNGTGGSVNTFFSTPMSATVQAGGKILVAGTASGAGQDFALARYNADGTFDTTFGSGTGKVKVDFFGGADQGQSVVVQQNGKIVVAGAATTSAGVQEFALVRFNADGTLDATFGAGTGKVVTNFGSTLAPGQSATLQPDGKILVSGYAVQATVTNYDFALARYNADGSLDTTFGNGTGRVMTDFTGGDDGQSVALQSDGKIVVSGYAGGNFAVARYNSDGSLDTSFGAGTGKVTTDFFNSFDIGGQTMVIQGDGKIVVSGYVLYPSGGTYDIALVRYNADGSLDSGFGGSALITLHEDATQPNLTASRIFAFDDIDLIDAHTVSVSAGASNTLGGSVVAKVTTSASGATLGHVDWTYTLDNSAVQRLAQGQFVTEFFAIEVDDGHGGTVNQTAAVRVVGVNDAPVAFADTNAGDAVTEAGIGAINNFVALLPGDPTASGNVLANDTDVDVGDTKQVSAVNGASGGVGAAVTGIYGNLVLGANGIYTYTLNNADPDTEALPQGAVANDVFTYTVRDSNGAESSTVLTITINGWNDRPVGIPDTNAADPVIESGVGAGNATVLGDATASGNVLTNDVDPDVGAFLTVARVNASDTTVGQPVSGTYGTLVVNLNGDYAYTLNNADTDTNALAQGALASDVFTYDVRDVSGHNTRTTLTIAISGTNDAPSANADTNAGDVVTEAGIGAIGGFVALLPGDPTASGNVLANDTDVDTGDTKQVIAINGAAAVGAAVVGTYGSLVLGADGAYTYTLDNADPDTDALPQGALASDVFSYTMRDSAGAEASANLSITIGGWNDEPVGLPDTNAVDPVVESGVGPGNTAFAGDPTAAGNVLVNDYDVDANAFLSVGRVNGDANAMGQPVAGVYGTLVLAADGDYSYTLNNADPDTNALAQGVMAHDTFTYSVRDQFGTLSTPNLDVVITGTNDAPTFGVSSAQLTYLDTSNFDEPVSLPLVNSNQPPEVATLADGGHVVVWSASAGGGNADASGFGVYQQRYDAAGSKIGNPQLVNSTTVNGQFSAGVAATGNGWVVTWTSGLQDGSQSGIYTQRFDAGGTKAGGEVRVNATTTGDQHGPSIAELTGGAYVVTWHGFNGPSAPDVFARVFNAASVALTGEFIVSTSTAGNQDPWGEYAESVAGLSGGRFVVVWQDTNGLDGSGSGVYGRVYESNGTPVNATQFRVNTTTISEQNYGSVGAVGTGFVVTWIAQDSSGYGIYAQRYDANGSALGGEFRVNTWTAGDQIYSKVVELSDGSFVIVWQSSGAAGNTSTEISGQRYSSSGIAIGGEFVVNSVDTPLAASGNEQFPSIDLRNDGALVVTWMDASTNMIEQRIVDDFASYTTPIGAFSLDEPVSLPISGSNLPAEVATLADGGHVVVWSASAGGGANPDASGLGVYQQRYNAAGEKLGNPQLVNTQTTSDQIYAGVAANGNGWVVTWSSFAQDGSGYGIYAQRYDSSGARAGAEVRLNTTTAGNQAESNITELTSGGYAVTWRGLNSATASDDIYARFFNAAGVAQTDEFVVNTSTAGFQTTDGNVTESVAGLSGGRLVVVWRDTNGLDGSGSGVYGRVYESNGTPVNATQFRVNTTITSEQNYGSVGAVETGFVVTWSSFSQDGGFGIYAQRYDANGSVLGSEFRANGWTAGDQLYSKVVELADGSFVIVWQSNGAAGNASTEISGQRYSSSGIAIGDEFIVNHIDTPLAASGNQQFPSIDLRNDGALVVSWMDASTSTIEQRIVDDFASDTTPIGASNLDEPVSLPIGNSNLPPEVAALADGGHVVVWSALAGGSNPDASGYGVYQQRYDSTGAKIGNPQLVNTLTASDQLYAGVAANGNGWVVTWSSFGQDGSSYGTYAQRYDTSGARVGGEALMNTTTVNQQIGSNVAELTGGGYVVTWQGINSTSASASDDIYARVFNAAGVAQTGEFVVNPSTAGVQLTDGSVTESVAGLSGGRFVVVWRDANDPSAFSDVYARVYEANGTPVNAAQIRVNTTTTSDQHDASVGAVGAGFVVTWSSAFQDGSGYGIYAQRYDANGSALGGEFRANTWTAGDQLYSKVVELADGSFVIVWQSSGAAGNTSTEISGQRYSSNGTAIGGEFIVNSVDTPFAAEQFPSIDLRNDGALVVTWMDASTNTIEQRIVTSLDGAATEDASSPVLSSSGTIRFGDVDIGDSHSASVTVASTNLLGGTLVASMTDPAAVDGAGTVTWTYSVPNSATQFLAAGHTVTESFTVTVNDGHGASFAQDVVVTVAGTNDTPVASADRAIVLRNSNGVVPVLANDTDVDARAVLTVAAVTNGASGSVVIDVATGNPRYTPNANFIGFDSYSYTMRDEMGATSSASVAVTVASVVGTELVDPALNGTNLPDLILGLGGNDTINAGAGANVADYVDAGLGNDTISGGTGADTLIGGPAVLLPGQSDDDTFLVTGSELDADSMDGGAGTDTLRFTGVVNLGAGFSLNRMEQLDMGGFQFNINTPAPVDLSSLTRVGTGANIIGDGGANIITGTQSGDFINSGAGSDTLRGDAGADYLNGDAGDDIVHGGSGGDTLIGSGGIDQLFGDDGDDIFSVGTTSLSGDTLDGGSGIDTLFFETTVTLGGTGVALSGVELLNMNGAQLNINTPAAIDLSSLTRVGVGGNIVGDGGANTITGTQSGDYIDGGGGDDIIRGAGGADILIGSGGADRLFGDDGDDTFSVGTTSLSGDSLDGGAGVDTLFFEGAITLSAGIALSGVELLNMNGAQLNVNTIASVDLSSLTRTGVGGNIVGNAEANTITGTQSGDFINSGGGSDTLRGDAGADYLNGDAGDDIIRGGSGDDTLIGSGGIDQLFGDEGADTFSVGTTSLSGDSLDGGAGIDTLLFESAINLGGTGFAMTGVEVLNMNGAQLNVNTTAAVDLSALTKTGTNALILGDGAANNITGTQSVDTINGGGGSDVLAGAGGNDTLIGGAAGDLVNGGAGDDTIQVAGTELTGDNINGGSDNDTLQFTNAITLGAGGFTISQVETLDMGGFAMTVQATTSVDLSSMTVINPGAIAGNGGSNRIVGSQSADNIDGAGGSDTLAGGGGADTIIGGGGDDFINGGLGNDILTADGGVDTFVFSTALDAANNVDTINSFSATGAAADKIALDPTVFAALLGGTTTGVDTGEIASNTGGNALDANDFILFDTATGNLFYDADGSGGLASRVQFAKMIGMTGSLDFVDFTTVLPPVP
jgi:uncharacterized delta-60 repeat protein